MENHKAEDDATSGTTDTTTGGEVPQVANIAPVVQPVSYTHLDVYKRQMMFRKVRIIMR